MRGRKINKRKHKKIKKENKEQGRNIDLWEEIRKVGNKY